MQAKLNANQVLLAEHISELPDGTKIITEVIKQGDQGIIIGSFIVEQSGPRLLNWCGYCDGVPVGCVNCPNNDPVLDCVSGSVYCAS